MLGEITDYDVISVIGSGSFGTCYKVRRKNDSKIFVWKAIDYGNLTEDKKELLVTEVNLLRSVRHPNVVQYYGYIVHKESTTLYVVMEHCVNGDLSALVHTCKRSNVNIQEGFIWRLVYQLAGALRALQDQGILHRDVKSANVFLDTEHNAKLGDFGLAKDTATGTGKKLEPLQAESFVGTPGYMSPEVVKGEKYDGKSDVWSLGCVAYELCSLKVPFTGHNMRQLARHIATGRFDPVPDHYSSELRRLIDFMLIVNSSHRPDIRAILHHPSVVSHLSTDQKTPPFPSNNTNQNLLERETLLRLRELAVEEKERKIKERENKLKPRSNFDIDSSAGLGDSPLFRPTTAKLNPALIPRPLHFPPPQRKVRFEDKRPKLDEVTYKWYNIDPPDQFKIIKEEFKRPLSDSGQNVTINSEFPVKPSSDGGDNYQNRGKYSMKDLEKAVSDTFLNGGKIKPQKFRAIGKENLVVKHTML